ncbi:hypothetical protein [Diplocloster hominis]|uniref:hypothetical protein n=1 Tax=Diplocloster hominis TaxID=3079010 RepID=UPI0031BB63B9
MGKKKRLLSALVAFAFVMGMVGVPALGGSKNAAVLSKWGSILSGYADKTQTLSEGDLYATGNSITVTKQEIEQATDFFMQTSDDYDTARAKAIDSAMKREALYAAAIEHGYTVTDEEIWAYLEDLKELMSKAANKDDVQAVIDAFPSEDDYWAYEYTVYQKNLPIEKYANDLRKAYYEQLANSGADEDYSLLWKDYYNQFQEQLVQEQEFQVVEQE